MTIITTTLGERRDAAHNHTCGTFIDIGDDLDDRRIHAISDRLDAAMTDGGSVVVLNFHSTSDIDEHGVAFLRDLSRTGDRRHVRVVLTEVPWSVRRQLADRKLTTAMSGADGEAILLCSGVV